MTFAQRRNRLKTCFSKRIPVVKRRMTVLTSMPTSYKWTLSFRYLHQKQPPPTRATCPTMKVHSTRQKQWTWSLAGLPDVTACWIVTRWLWLTANGRHGPPRAEGQLTNRRNSQGDSPFCPFSLPVPSKDSEVHNTVSYFFVLAPWRWRKKLPPKRWISIEIYDVIS